MTEDTGITRTLFAVATLGLAFWITLILAIFDLGPFR